MVTESEAQEIAGRKTNNRLKIFKAVLGGAVLLGLLYMKFVAHEEVDYWFFIIPGLLLGYDPRLLLKVPIK